MQCCKIFYLIIIFYVFAGFAQALPENPAEFQSELIAPKKILNIGQNHYLLDFGQDAFGTVLLPSGMCWTDTLVIHLGEKLAENGWVDRNPGGTIRYQRVAIACMPQKGNYLVKLLPVKRNTNPPAIALPDSFGVIMPFRYCEIENLSAPFWRIADIRQKIFHYKFDDNAAAFSCSDTILNKVWKMCKQTIKATSFCGLYIDGDRERTPYEADAYINQLSHYCIDNEYTLAKRTDEYFIHHPTWPTEWILHTVLLFFNDYLYTGNADDLASHYQALKTKTLIDLERPAGLISVHSRQMNDSLMKALGFRDTNQRLSDIVDWPNGERDGYDMRDVNTVPNAFHYKNLTLMADIASLLGHTEDAAFFRAKSILVRDTFNRLLFDRVRGVYVDGEGSSHASLHANMFALVFGLVPPERVPSVLAFVKSRGMACSVYGAQYLLDALYQYGEADDAMRLMDDTADRSWWNMMREGSTMAMEAWGMKYKPNSDWNHAWGTAPLNIITRCLWGITPMLPGFALVRIAPQMSNLSFSTIKVPTIKGQITGDYKEINGKKHFVIVLPDGMSGEFIWEKAPVAKTGLTATAKTYMLHPGVNTIEVDR